MKHKFSVLAYDNIITGDIKGAFKKMANEWKFLPGPTQQKQKPAVTEESLMKEFKEAFVNELNGVSDLKTPKGQLLNPFKK
jgi:hypothetical protein